MIMLYLKSCDVKKNYRVPTYLVRKRQFCARGHVIVTCKGAVRLRGDPT